MKETFEKIQYPTSVVIPKDFDPLVARNDLLNRYTRMLELGWEAVPNRLVGTFPLPSIALRPLQQLSVCAYEYQHCGAGNHRVCMQFLAGRKDTIYLGSLGIWLLDLIREELDPGYAYVSYASSVDDLPVLTDGSRGVPYQFISPNDEVVVPIDFFGCTEVLTWRIALLCFSLSSQRC